MEGDGQGIGCVIHANVVIGGTETRQTGWPNLCWLDIQMDVLNKGARCEDLRIVEAVHGIYTGTENWNDDLRRWSIRNNSGLIVEEYNYGFQTFSGMLACGWIPFVGRHKASKFNKWFKKDVSQLPAYPVNFVGHSFGTWMIHELLWRNPSIKANAVVLFASVLSSHFKETKFPQMFARKQIKKLVVLWSPKDEVVHAFCQPFRIPFTNYDLSPFGHLGCRGFVDGIDRENVKQFETKETHSSYFHKANQDYYFEIIDLSCECY